MEKAAWLCLGGKVAQLLCASVPLIRNEDFHAVLQLIGCTGSFVMGKCVWGGIPEAQDVIVLSHKYNYMHDIR